MSSIRTRFSIHSVDQVTVEERARSFRTRSIKSDAKVAGLRLAVSMLDLTTLEGKDTPGKVAHLCRKALRPMPARYNVSRCAAVCVYPNMVKEACELTAGSGIAVASVATAFPSGQFPLKLKLRDVEYAVSQGAAEIDMVIDRGAFLCGEYRKVAREITAVKEACGEAHLKVIFETASSKPTIA